MAMSKALATRQQEYLQFERAVPDWFSDAKLGIFVHWGPYSVPAWAEPIGQLGTIDFATWYRHNPYAEWYANTCRIAGSPAQAHHAAEYSGAPYDDFLDSWRAERFDADALLAYFSSVGARYFVPTTKHHDGVALWDAPGTDGRNTVVRGPQRDLIGEFAGAARRAGLRFGVYYSGGLDWHFDELPPIVDGEAADTRPVDAGYARYVADHVLDLIQRYSPDVLWNDIEWPDAGKAPGPFSLIEVLRQFYAAQPDGVVNDRFGDTHWDFRTSEYQLGGNAEADGAWENNRGIGYSFGQNRLETAAHTLSGPDAVRHFVDVVARGGNLLLNVGLDAAGEVPPLQRATLDVLREWNAVNGHAIFGSRPLLSAEQARGEIATRWTATDGAAHAFVTSAGAGAAAGVAELGPVPAGVDPTSARYADGSPARLDDTGSSLRVTVPPSSEAPVLISFLRNTSA